MLINRFADPDMEAEYVRAERAARAVTTRILLLISLTALFIYVVVNPIYFSAATTQSYNIAAASFIIILAAFVSFTFSRWYPPHTNVDLAVFLAIIVPMYLLVDALAGETDVTGFPINTLGVVNFGILSVVAAIIFIANFRNFLIWFLVMGGVFVFFVLSLDASPISKFYTLSTFFTFHLVGVFGNREIDRRARAVFVANMALEDERERTEDLLFNVLPQDVAARLKSGETVADSFSDVSVIFVDIVDFSKLAKQLTARHLVDTLNEFFLIGDECADAHGIEKVKTIGDSYLAVSGGTASAGSGALAAVAFGRDLIEKMQLASEESGIDIKLRIGVHSGPVVGGVVGVSRLAYDYWGDTMNIASRIEGIAEPNGIAVSEATYFQTKSQVAYSPVETITLKGVGETQVYRVVM